MDAPNGLDVTVNEYRLIQLDDGSVKCLRNGDDWRDCTGDGLILGLGHEVEALRIELAIIKTREAARDEIRGYCHACKTGIYGRDSMVVDPDNKSYHPLCLVSGQRNEAWEVIRLLVAECNRHRLDRVERKEYGMSIEMMGVNANPVASAGLEAARKESAR